MASIKGFMETVTGGTGNVGELNRQRMLWGGRAQAKRAASRIDALEQNQQSINASNKGLQQQTGGSTLSPEDKAKMVNPLNVGNITITQVQAGNSKKDVLFAQKVSEKNTKFLEQFTKSAKQIALNTKNIVKQDTKIKKEQNTATGKGGSGSGSGAAPIKAAAETGGWLSNMIGESWKFFLLSNAGKIAKGIFSTLTLGGLLKYLRPTKALSGLSSLASTLGKFKPGNLKTMMWSWGVLAEQGLKSKLLWLKNLPAGGFSKVKGFLGKVATLGKAEWGALMGIKDKVKNIGGSGKFGKGLRGVGKGVGGFAAGYAGYYGAYAVARSLGMSEKDFDKNVGTSARWVMAAIDDPKNAWKEAKALFTDPVTYQVITDGAKNLWKETSTFWAKQFGIHTDEGTAAKKASKAKTEAKSRKRIAAIKAKLLWAQNNNPSMIPEITKELSALLISYKKMTGQEYWNVQIVGERSNANWWMDIVASGKSITGQDIKNHKKTLPPVGTKNKARESTFSGANNISKKFGANKKLNDSLGIDDSGVPLGQKVNGLIPPIWPELDIDEGYRKVIDVIENGNTGSYTIGSGRSSAYGRYQFMPATAIGVALKIGIHAGAWKLPINQDKIFQKFTADNKKAISNRGFDVNVWSMWIAHNLGTGALNFMLGSTDKPYRTALRDIKNQMPGKPQYKTAVEARTAYTSYYKDRIAKITGGASNAPAPKSSGATFKSNITIPKPKPKPTPARKTQLYNLSNISNQTGQVGPIDYTGQRVAAGSEWMKANNIGDVIILSGSASMGGFAGLDKKFAQRVASMATEYMSITGKKLKVVSAYRDINHQARLFASALTRYKSKARARKHVAPAGNSMHNWGLAVDIDFPSGNQVNHCAALGLLDKYKLYRPMSNEDWHVEPIETIGNRGQKGRHVVLDSDAEETRAVILSTGTGGISSPNISADGSINVGNMLKATGIQTAPSSGLKGYKPPVPLSEANMIDMINASVSSSALTGRGETGKQPGVVTEFVAASTVLATTPK